MPISLSLKIILLTRNQALKLISFLSFEIFLNSVGKQFCSVQPTISVNFHFSFPFLAQPSWLGSVHLYLNSCQNLFIDLSLPVYSTFWTLIVQLYWMGGTVPQRLGREYKVLVKKGQQVLQQQKRCWRKRCSQQPGLLLEFLAADACIREVCVLSLVVRGKCWCEVAKRQLSP